MKLYQFISATIHPYEVIMIFDKDSHTLYDLFDFVNISLKKGIPYNRIFNGYITNICVNGPCIQCEVIIDD